MGDDWRVAISKLEVIQTQRKVISLHPNITASNTTSYHNLKKQSDAYLNEDIKAVVMKLYSF